MGAETIEQLIAELHRLAALVGVTFEPDPAKIATIRKP